MGDMGNDIGKGVKESEVVGGGGMSERMWKGGGLGLLYWRYRDVVCSSLEIQTPFLQLLLDGLGMSYMSGFFCFNGAPPPLLSSYP